MMKQRKQVRDGKEAWYWLVEYYWLHARNLEPDCGVFEDLGGMRELLRGEDGASVVLHG
jgi:hypothetical protein